MCPFVGCTSLAPEEGRSLILGEIRSLHPRVGIKALGILPDESLPELDEVLAEMLETSKEGQLYEPLITPSRLVERYATLAILPRIKVAYESGGGYTACKVLAPLLAYFLRVDRSLGADLVRKELRARKAYCYSELVGNIARLHMSAELEQIAIEHLRDPDARLAADAARTLSRFGSPAAEGPLWRAMERWHREWKGHEAQFRYRSFGNSLSPEKIQHNWQVGFDATVAEALAQARTWLLEEKKLKKLRDLCITVNCRHRANLFLQRWEPPISIIPGFTEGGYWGFSVAQYESLPFEAGFDKLAQFPEGTVFRWYPYSSRRLVEEVNHIFSDVKMFLEENGMKLENADKTSTKQGRPY